MKKNLKGISFFASFLALLTINYIAAMNNPVLNELDLKSLIVANTAVAETVQFCTREWQPFWGICKYTGNPSVGFDCYYIAHGCSLCDCDGTWIMEI